MKRLLFVLALLCAQLSHAATKPSFSTVPFNQTGNAAQIAQPGASLTAFPGVGNISPTSNSGWYQAGNYGVAPAATGTTMNMNIMGDVGFSGVKYPWQAAYAVPQSNLWNAASGIASVLGGPYVGAGLLALPFVLDWMTKAGIRQASDGSGFELHNDATCKGASPCGMYYMPSSSAGLSRSSMSAVCQDSAVALAGAGSTGTLRFITATSVWLCDMYRANGTSYPSGWGFSTRTVTAAQSYLPASMNDISPYMARTEANPDGRIVQELLDKGADIVMPTPTVTGPASVTGPSSTTVNPDGTKVVTSTTSNFTNSGNTITNTSNVTTNNTYNTSNVITSTSSTTVTPAASAYPVDACTNTPDSAGCAKLGDVPTGDKLNKTTHAVNVVAQTFAGGGSCPPPVNFTLSVGPIRGTYGFSYSPLCNALLLIRGVILALAALMAAYILADSFKV